MKVLPEAENHPIVADLTLEDILVETLPFWPTIPEPSGHAFSGNNFDQIALTLFLYRADDGRLYSMKVQTQALLFSWIVAVLRATTSLAFYALAYLLLNNLISQGGLELLLDTLESCELQPELSCRDKIFGAFFDNANRCASVKMEVSILHPRFQIPIHAEFPVFLNNAVVLLAATIAMGTTRWFIGHVYTFLRNTARIAEGAAHEPLN